jgi:hypothetical protein
MREFADRWRVIITESNVYDGTILPDLNISGPVDHSFKDVTDAAAASKGAEIRDAATGLSTDPACVDDGDWH